METFIGVIKKDGTIRTVEYLDDGAIDVLGITLCEFYQASADVKKLIKTTVISVDEEEVQYDQDSPSTYETYDDLEDFTGTVDLETNVYYLYNGIWNVIGNGSTELSDLEDVIEEGNY